MLGGRLGNLEFRKGREAGGQVEIEVRGALIDPMDRVTGAALLVARADGMKDKPAVGTGGRWAAMPGAERVELKVAGRGVSGTVKLPVRERDRGQIEFLFQPACVDRDGKTTYFAPVTGTLREGPAPGLPFVPPGIGDPPGGRGGPSGPRAGVPGPPKIPGPPMIPFPMPPGAPAAPGAGPGPGGGFGGGFGPPGGGPRSPGSGLAPPGGSAPGGAAGSGSGGPGFGGGFGGGFGPPGGGPATSPGRPGG
jgi:hypothetical protein